MHGSYLSVIEQRMPTRAGMVGMSDLSPPNSQPGTLQGTFTDVRVREQVKVILPFQSGPLG